ncbi:MAG: biotin/lipoyl-containing protein, partial [Acidimicrobiia bacterium]
MAIDVLMPVIDVEGEEAVVTAWLVDEGTRVKPAQLIAEVQAEKVSVDVEAPAAGVVRGLVPINQPVAQGSSICRIEEDSEEVVAPTPPP